MKRVERERKKTELGQKRGGEPEHCAQISTHGEKVGQREKEGDVRPPHQVQQHPRSREREREALQNGNERRQRVREQRERERESQRSETKREREREREISAVPIKGRDPSH